VKRGRIERGLHELYANDAEAADAALWGRVSDPLTRRGFLRGAGVAAMGAAIGMHIPFSRNLPMGLIPAAFAETREAFQIPGKHAGLVLLNDRPLNAETPPHLLDDEVTPADRLFVRNNGIPPTDMSAANWKLEIGGEAIESERSFGIAELRRDFESHTLQLQLECAGNGRSEFRPPASGNQWTTGAVGCPTWTGVRLRDVLERCGVQKNAAYIGYYGADSHLSGDPNKVVISRGVPMGKALQDETLIAWAMNGSEIPALHGAPLRLVCGGWPGSTSGKWLRRIDVRDRVHDGPKMGGKSYRVPCRSVAPGEPVDDSEMCIIESLPVKSLITSIRSGSVHAVGKALAIAGPAWAGELEIAAVDVSIDFGQTWRPCRLSPPKNRLAWQRFRTTVALPAKGYFEVWARATDSRGQAQPMVVPGWNPKGYLNNACHRVAVRAA